MQTQTVENTAANLVNFIEIEELISESGYLVLPRSQKDDFELLIVSVLIKLISKDPGKFKRLSKDLDIYFGFEISNRTQVIKFRLKNEPFLNKRAEYLALKFIEEY